MEITDRQQSEIQSALESLEMIYNFHDEIEDHNETMWKAVQKIAGALVVHTMDIKEKIGKESFRHMQINGFVVTAQQYKNDPDALSIILMNKNGASRAMTFDITLDLIAASPIIPEAKKD